MAIKVEPIPIDENVFEQIVTERNNINRPLRTRLFKWGTEVVIYETITQVFFLAILAFQLRWLNIGQKWGIIGCVNG